MEENNKPRQFDWLKKHLEWFDKLAPPSEPKPSKEAQEIWENLLGDGLNRYVVNAVSFMDRPLPIEVKSVDLESK